MYFLAGVSCCIPLSFRKITKRLLSDQDRHHEQTDLVDASFANALNPSPQIIFSFTRRQILDSSKLKEFADDNFSFEENGRKLSKWVENIVGKGEIARYEQFLLFPPCFQKACFLWVSKGVIVWE